MPGGPPMPVGVGVGQLALRVAQLNEDIARRPVRVPHLYQLLTST